MLVFWGGEVYVLFFTLEKINNTKKNLRALDGQKILQKLSPGKYHIILHGFSTIQTVVFSPDF